MRRDGGPAFPQPDSMGQHAGGGMTLRDWFAGQAMLAAGGAAALEFTRKIEAGEELPTGDDFICANAAAAYRIADAMMAEREKS